MGREIRRVPPNWEHPQETKWNFLKGREETNYHPLYDEGYKLALEEWITNMRLWEKKEHSDQKDEDAKFHETYPNYWDWAGGPPKPAYYRPDWKPEEMTWWQVYETVSEGTPVTPPFETQAELVEYLVENGDFWDQIRRKEGYSAMRCTPWPRKEAEAFVYGSGWAPSLVVTDGKIMSGTEAFAEMKEQRQSADELPTPEAQEGPPA